MQNNNFFICPASNYLNKYNEKGSIGQFSYEFLEALSSATKERSVSAVVFNSYKVKSFSNVEVIKEYDKEIFNGFDSLFFYIKTFFRFIFDPRYTSSTVIHHFQPFAMNLTFNPFFIMRSSKKKYILGPLIGPHVANQVFKDEDFLKSNESRWNDSLQTVARRLSGKLLSYLNKLTIQKTDFVWFSDEYAVSSFKHLLKEHQKYGVLGIGVDLRVFDRKSVNRSDSFTVLFCGRLTERKGCEYLIRAIGLLHSANPAIDIKCLIAGFGVLENELKQLCKDLKVDHLIEFIGGVESNHDFVDIYNRSDVFCAPALSDTWVSTKEALCCGVPVITTDLGAHSSHIVDGVNGFLIESKSSEQIAEKLEFMITNPQVVNALKNSAYASRVKYDWNTIVDKYLGVTND